MYRAMSSGRKIPYNPRLKARARELRKNLTLGEGLLWRELKGKSLGVEFHRQAPIDEYIVDFYCHELMLAVEVDGAATHVHSDRGERDIARQKRLESLGVKFLRFAEVEVRRDVGAVVRAIELWVNGALGR